MNGNNRRKLLSILICETVAESYYSILDIKKMTTSEQIVRVYQKLHSLAYQLTWMIYIDDKTERIVTLKDLPLVLKQLAGAKNIEVHPHFTDQSGCWLLFRALSDMELHNAIEEMSSFYDFTPEGVTALMMSGDSMFVEKYLRHMDNQYNHRKLISLLKNFIMSKNFHYALTFMVIILAMVTVSRAIKETQTIYLEEDGTATVERSSWAGLHTKMFQARVRNGNWEIRQLYEKTPLGIKKVTQPFQRVIFIETLEADSDDRC